MERDLSEEPQTCIHDDSSAWVDRDGELGLDLWPAERSRPLNNGSENVRAQHPLWSPTDWYVQKGSRTGSIHGEWFPRPKCRADPTNSPFILPIDIITLIFSHCSFRERSKCSMINWAFYQAYYTYVCDKPFAEIILSGDYLNLARRLAAEPIAIRARLNRSDSFSQLCVYGGPTFAVYLGLGYDEEIEEHHLEERCRGVKPYPRFESRLPRFSHRQPAHHRPINDSPAGIAAHTFNLEPADDNLANLFEPECGTIGWLRKPRRAQRLPILTLICKYGLQGAKPEDFPPDILLLDILLRNHHYNDANQVPYNDLIKESVRCCLRDFHLRCVPSTPINRCLHDSHAHLSAEIPQIVCDLHDIAEIGPEVLCELIGLTLRQNNQTDLQWLRARYSAIFVKASCIRSMVNFSDGEDSLCMLKQIMYCVNNIEWILERDRPLDAFFAYVRRNRVARGDFDNLNDPDNGDNSDFGLIEYMGVANPADDIVVDTEFPPTDWALYPDSIHRTRGTGP